MRHVLYCSERHVQERSKTLEMNRMARAWGACDVTGVVGGEEQRGWPRKSPRAADGLIGVTWNLRRPTSRPAPGQAAHCYLPYGSRTRICPPPGTMRTAFLFGRQCCRPGLPKLATRAFTRPSTAASRFRRQFATPNFKGRTILWSGAAAGAAGGAILSPLAFVDVANDKSGHGEKTHEEAMLEASRKELDEQVPHALRHSTKYRRGIYFFIEDYIIEPIATGFRFLHLIIIFVPVIVTIPAIWLGSRQPDRDNERSGTLWWYGFLVGSMERAGAAFIKVRAVTLDSEDIK